MQNFRLRLDQDHYNLSEPVVFSGGEIHVDISHMPTSCYGFTLKARLQSSADIMHMFMLCDALGRRYPDAEGIIEIPYLPYARQDRMCASGQHFGLEMFTTMLSALPNNIRILKTRDLHSPVAKRLIESEACFFVHELTQAVIISSYEPLSNRLITGSLYIVAPDKGARDKAYQVADNYNMVPYFGEKVRDPKTGKLTGFDVNCQDFGGQDLLIVDDICDGGGTFIGLAEVLRARNCGNLNLYVTHGIFSRGFEELAKVFDKVYTTDSFRSDVNNTHGLELITIKV